MTKPTYKEGSDGMKTFGGFRRSVATGVAALALFAALAAVAQGSRDRAPRRGAVEVDIRGFAYYPALLRVEKGARVVFANRDGAAHDAARRGSFSTCLLRPGEAATVRFRNRGTFPYVCTLHPGMRGKVVVG